MLDLATLLLLLLLLLLSNEYLTLLRPTQSFNRQFHGITPTGAMRHLGILCGRI